MELAQIHERKLQGSRLQVTVQVSMQCDLGAYEKGKSMKLINFLP